MPGLIPLPPEDHDGDLEGISFSFMTLQEASTGRTLPIMSLKQIIVLLQGTARQCGGEDASDILDQMARTLQQYQQKFEN